MSLPSKTMRPAVGASAPVIRLNSVDLPHPLGPTSAVSWPLSSAKETPSTAASAPNALRSSLTSRSAIGTVPSLPGGSARYSKALSADGESPRPAARAAAEKGCQSFGDGTTLCPVGHRCVPRPDQREEDHGQTHAQKIRRGGRRDGRRRRPVAAAAAGRGAERVGEGGRGAAVLGRAGAVRRSGAHRPGARGGRDQRRRRHHGRAGRDDLRGHEDRPQDGGREGAQADPARRGRRRRRADHVIGPERHGAADAAPENAAAVRHELRGRRRQGRRLRALSVLLQHGAEPGHGAADPLSAGPERRQELLHVRRQLRLAAQYVRRRQGHHRRDRRRDPGRGVHALRRHRLYVHHPQDCRFRGRGLAVRAAPAPTASRSSSRPRSSD